LRITFSAAHSEQQVDHLLAALEGLMVSGQVAGGS
jgi:7-keto-8-aminopelargonate synthetase-like enzyme